MTELSYASAPLAVREDLDATHRRAWQRLAEPGTWWTGAERVAIAAETRHALHCRLCRERKDALSPYAIDGAHDSLGGLPEPVVDVIHRVRTDPGRLTKSWFDRVMAQELDDAQYVEVVGVVVSVVCVDTFARGIGAPLPELPVPVPGEPSRLRPASAKDDRAWVPMIAPADATGPEADVYGGADYAPYIARALSLVPAEVRQHQEFGEAHYMPMGQLMEVASNGGRAITRPQIELIAARVSALNGCFY